MVGPVDIEAEQVRRWKELWDMNDDEWDATWEYFYEVAACKAAELEARLRYGDE